MNPHDVAAELRARAERARPQTVTIPPPPSESWAWGRKAGLDEAASLVESVLVPEGTTGAVDRDASSALSSTENVTVDRGIGEPSPKSDCPVCGGTRSHRRIAEVGPAGATYSGPCDSRFHDEPASTESSQEGRGLTDEQRFDYIATMLEGDTDRGQIAQYIRHCILEPKPETESLGSGDVAQVRLGEARVDANLEGRDRPPSEVREAALRLKYALRDDPAIGSEALARDIEVVVGYVLKPASPEPIRGHDKIIEDDDADEGEWVWSEQKGEDE